MRGSIVWVELLAVTRFVPVTVRATLGQTGSNERVGRDGGTIIAHEKTRLYRARVATDNADTRDRVAWVDFTQWLAGL